MAHILPSLPYAYDALEPYVDARTMEIHHSKHHQAYVDNLNKALEKHPELQKLTLDQLIAAAYSVPEAVRSAVVNHGGGHYNHTLFWQMMKQKGGGKPVGNVAEQVDKQFGSFAAFQQQFELAAKGVFGSGWAWLTADAQGKLAITSSANQESPAMKGNHILLGLDVWEHAYYLHYQNRRADYIAAWWQVVHWEYVEERYRKECA